MPTVSSGRTFQTGRAVKHPYRAVGLSEIRGYSHLELFTCPFRER